MSHNSQLRHHCILSMNISFMAPDDYIRGFIEAELVFSGMMYVACSQATYRVLDLMCGYGRYI